MIPFNLLNRREQLNPNTNTLRLGHRGLIDLNGIELFTELEYLDCSHNQIESIPDLRRLSRLRVLNLSYNRLTCLPPLPQSLEKIDCGHNRLTQIPTLSIRLSELILAFNQVESLHGLEQLPLRLLDARVNRLRKLPALPQSIAVALFEENPIAPDDEDEEVET